MNEIDLKEFISVLWAKKLQIIIIVLIFLVLGIFYTQNLVVPKYCATTTLVLVASDEQESSTNTTMTATDIAINSKLVATYSELIKSKTILQEVINQLELLDLNVETLKKQIKVQAIKNTELIKIDVEDIEPVTATNIANELVKTFTQKIKEIYNINNVQIIQEAETPKQPSNINKTRDVMLFVAIGLVFAIGYAIISNTLDTTIKSGEEIEKEFKESLLISIPFIESFKSKKKKEIITQQDPKSPISEVFRTLRTNIQFRNKNKEEEEKTILITSTLSGEGKSSIASNLAVTFAQTRKKVVLVDSDMRRGRQHEIFNTPNVPGLSNYLSQIGIEEKENDSEEMLRLYSSNANTKFIFNTSRKYTTKPF